MNKILNSILIICILLFSPICLGMTPQEIFAAKLARKICDLYSQVVAYQNIASRSGYYSTDTSFDFKIRQQLAMGYPVLLSTRPARELITSALIQLSEMSMDDLEIEIFRSLDECKLMIAEYQELKRLEYQEMKRKTLEPTVSQLTDQLNVLAVDHELRLKIQKEQELENAMGSLTSMFKNLGI